VQLARAILGANNVLGSNVIKTTKNTVKKRSEIILMIKDIIKLDVILLPKHYVRLYISSYDKNNSSR